MIGLRFCGCAALLVIGMFAGCSTEAVKGTVEGTVTLNSQPLEHGLIRFVPIDGKLQPADATITAGKYTATIPVGDVRVEITSPKVVGQTKMYPTPDSPTVDKIEELLPPKYNVQSELKMSVPKGKTEKPFELTTP
jgi:hypothetical protein